MAWRQSEFGRNKKIAPNPWLLTFFACNYQPNFDEYFTQPRIIAVNEQEFARTWDTKCLLKRREELGEEESDSKYFLTYASDMSRSIRTFISKSILDEMESSSGENRGEIDGNSPENSASDQNGNRKFELLITKYKLRVHFSESWGVTPYLVVDEGRKWRDENKDPDFVYYGFHRLCIIDDQIYERMKKQFGRFVCRSWELRTRELGSSSFEAAGNAIENWFDNLNGDRSGDETGNNSFIGSQSQKRDHDGNRIQSQPVGGSTEESQLLSALVDQNFSTDRTDDQIEDVRIVQVRNNGSQTDSDLTGFDDGGDIQEAARESPWKSVDGSPSPDDSPINFLANMSPWKKVDDSLSPDLTTPINLLANISRGHNSEDNSVNSEEIVLDPEIKTRMEWLVQNGKKLVNTVGDGNGDQMDVDGAQSGDDGMSSPKMETRQGFQRKARQKFHDFKLPEDILDKVLELVLMDTDGDGNRGQMDVDDGQSDESDDSDDED